MLKEMLINEVLPKKTTETQKNIIIKAIQDAANEQRNQEQEEKGSNPQRIEKKLLSDLKEYLAKSLSVLEQMSESEESLLDQHYYLLNKEWLSSLENRKPNEILYNLVDGVEPLTIQATDSFTYEALVKIHASIESRLKEFNEGYISKDNTYSRSLLVIAKGFNRAFPDYKISYGENTPFFKLTSFLFEKVFCHYQSPVHSIKKLQKSLK